MQPKPISTPEEYAEAVGRIEELMIMNPPDGSPEAEELYQWGDYMAQYEEVHFSV